jgi:hypothetical protein
MRGRETSESSNLTRKLLPLSTSLLTVRSPPITLVKSLVMVRPRPVPTVALARAVRARSNGRKIRSRSLLWMPTPVSSIVNWATW